MAENICPIQSKRNAQMSKIKSPAYVKAELTLTVSQPTPKPRKFPRPYRLNIPSLEQAKRNGATRGIRDSEHMIGYYTEEIAELVAKGPLEDEGFEEDRLDSLGLFKNTLEFKQKQLAKHQTVLASLPAEEE
jgi:hypothetical protein